MDVHDATELYTWNVDLLNFPLSNGPTEELQAVYILITIKNNRSKEAADGKSDGRA